MHTAETAYETLDLLWNNYLELAEQVDPEKMPSDKLAEHAGAPLRPFRIAAWLGRQGYFVAAWGLWEYFSRSLCGGLYNLMKQNPQESHVQWVNRSMTANGLQFTKVDWFRSANGLRNLIAHHGARVVGNRPTALLERAREVAFPELLVFTDRYVDISPDHVVDLQLNIEDFIRESDRAVPSPPPPESAIEQTEHEET